MTRQEIFTLVNLLTENKGKPLAGQFPALFSFICQDICKRKRYWWRKITVSFQTTIGSVATNYDLLSISTTPSISELVFEEISEILLMKQPIANNPQFSRLTPIFDGFGRASILQNNIQGPPGRYGFINNDWHNLTLDPSDQAYTLYIDGWAMPNPATDSDVDTVPLIPPWGHNTIVHGMCMTIWGNAYGMSDSRAADYEEKYEQGINDLQMRAQFTSDSNVQLINSTEHAVRST